MFAADRLFACRLFACARCVRRAWGRSHTSGLFNLAHRVRRAPEHPIARGLFAACCPFTSELFAASKPLNCGYACVVVSAVTVVPMFSPFRMREMLPGTVRSNTRIGSSLSMHSDVAVESITCRPFASTSM